MPVSVPGTAATAENATLSAPWMSLPSALMVTGAFSLDWVALSLTASGTSSVIEIVNVPGALSPSMSVTTRLKVTVVVSPEVLSAKVKV